MRPARILVWALATACVLPTAAAAQDSLVLRGEVVLPDGTPASGVPVSLQIHDGTQVVHEEAALADDRGRAVFEEVPVGGGHLARLAAIYADVTYYSDPIALDDAGPEATLRLQVAPVGSEGRPLHLDTLHLIIQAESPTRLRVLQFVNVSNAGEGAWAGGPELATGQRAGLEIPIPAAATEVTPAPFPSSAAALPADRIEIGQGRILDPRPVPPTGRQAAVTYLLETPEAVEVALPLPYPTQSVSVLLGGGSAGSVSLDRTNLTRRPPEEVGGEAYESWTASALEPGSEIRFRIGPPSPPLLPPYGWALAGLGLMLLIAVGATLSSRPGARDLQQRDRLMENIARLDLRHERGELEGAEYHMRRGRELERLTLLEERLGDDARPGDDRADD